MHLYLFIYLEGLQIFLFIYLWTLGCLSLSIKDNVQNGFTGNCQQRLGITSHPTTRSTDIRFHLSTGSGGILFHIYRV